MLKIAAIVIALLIVAMLFYAATKPDSFRVQRSVSIRAPADKIFPLINDLHQWDAWTPYNKDPAMKTTFGGAPTGVGSTYAWHGNSQVGQGDIEISASIAPRKVALNLHMIKPFEANNTVEFTLQTKGDVTDVSWAMDGKQVFIGKVLGIFMNMDNMVGKDFEVGLERMKVLAEGQAAPSHIEN